MVRCLVLAQQGLVADIRLDRHFTEGHDNAAKATRLRTATLMFIGLHNGRGWLL
jgi:hypothetical protein